MAEAAELISVLIKTGHFCSTHINTHCLWNVKSLLKF